MKYFGFWIILDEKILLSDIFFGHKKVFWYSVFCLDDAVSALFSIFLLPHHRESQSCLHSENRCSDTQPFWYSTVFENNLKCLNWVVQFWHFLPIFVLFNLTSLVTLFDRKLQIFKKSPKLTIFNELLSTQNVNVARFARNVKWDFFCDFQPLCIDVNLK